MKILCAMLILLPSLSGCAGQIYWTGTDDKGNRWEYLWNVKRFMDSEMSKPAVHMATGAGFSADATSQTVNAEAIKAATEGATKGGVEAAMKAVGR